MRTFKVFSIAVLLALAVTVMGLSLNEVEKTTSPIESFWSSIPDQYKTKLKVYSEEGTIAYVIELVPVNKTTLGEGRVNIVPFIAGIGPEKISQSILFLYYIHKPEGIIKRHDFVLSNLIITIPKKASEYPEKIYFSDNDVTGYLAWRANKRLLDYGVPVFEPMTGVFRLSPTATSLLKKAKDEEKTVFIYYKGGGPRVELKLPGEI